MEMSEKKFTFRVLIGKTVVGFSLVVITFDVAKASSTIKASCRRILGLHDYINIRCLIYQSCTMDNSNYYLS